jgi:hypothetical protein
MVDSSPPTDLDDPTVLWLTNNSDASITHVCATEVLYIVTGHQEFVPMGSSKYLRAVVLSGAPTLPTIDPAPVGGFGLCVSTAFIGTLYLGYFERLAVSHYSGWITFLHHNHKP